MILDHPCKAAVKSDGTLSRAWRKPKPPAAAWFEIDRGYGVERWAVTRHYAVRHDAPMVSAVSGDKPFFPSWLIPCKTMTEVGDVSKAIQARYIRTQRLFPRPDAAAAVSITVFVDLLRSIRPPSQERPHPGIFDAAFAPILQAGVVSGDGHPLDRAGVWRGGQLIAAVMPLRDPDPGDAICDSDGNVRIVPPPEPKPKKAKAKGRREP